MSLDIKISPENLLNWGNFSDWVDGAASAPTEHTLSGAGAAVARESSTIKQGTYSAKVTRGGADASIYHDLDNYDDYRGRKMTLGCCVYATVADGVSAASDSSYHTGGSGWEYITVTHDMNPCASQLRVSYEVNTGDTAVYFDGSILVEGASTFLIFSDVMDVAKFRPTNRFTGQIFNIPRRQGARVPNMQLQTKSISLEGMIVGSTAATARTNHDTLNKALNSVRIKADNDKEMRELYLFDDRKIKVYLDQNNSDYRAALRVRDIKLRFIAPCPFEFSTNMTRHKETISSTPTTFTISTVGGNVYSKPIITVTNNGSNITSLVIENLTSGQLATYTGSIVTGQDFVLDTTTLTVTNNGVEDLANFTGDTDLQLLPEDNEIKIVGLVNGIVKVDWYDRYYS